MNTPSQWEQVRRPLVEAAAKLAVRVEVDNLTDQVTLHVDASELASEDQVQVWQLFPARQGEWYHDLSGGEPCSLSESLQAIAACYVDARYR